MLEDIRGRALKKIKPDFNSYLIYIFISIFLGLGLEFKLFDILFANLAQLINLLLISLEFKLPYLLFDISISPNEFLQLSNISTIGHEIDHELVLSTSAAILAIIFSLIFGFLLAILQITDPYTYSLIYDSKNTKRLMVLYLGTIVLSLLMLETTFKFPVFILFLSFLSILSLHPFLHKTSKILVHEVTLKDLLDKLYSLIDSNKDLLTINRKIGSLGEITKETIKDNRLPDFFDIMRIFDTITSKAAEQKIIEVIETIGMYYSVFLDRLIEKNSTTDTTRSMLLLLFAKINSYINDYSEIIGCESLYLQADSLKEAGTKMIKARFNDEYVNKIIETLCNMFFSMQKKRNVESEINCLKYKLEPNIVEYIGILAMELFNRKFELSSLTTSGVALFAIGAKAYQVKEKTRLSELSSSGTILGQLKKIEDIIGNDNFERLFNESKHSKKYIFREPELEQYLDKFKTYYDEEKMYLS